MSGIINSHQMDMQKNAKFIRIVHLENNEGSLYLSDLDAQENIDNQKIPVYIPHGETIDILLTDRTLTAYQQGSIRGFIKQDFIDAFIVQSIEVDENVEQFVPLYEVEIDDQLITADSSSDDVLVELPEIQNQNFKDRAPEGTRLTVKKISTDNNRVIISPQTGEQIEGSTGSYVIQNPYTAVTLQSDDLGNWWVINEDSSTSSGGSGGSKVIETFDITTYGTQSITLSNNIETNSEEVLWNGVELTKGSSYDYTISGDTITFVSGIDLLPDDHITVRYFPDN